MADQFSRLFITLQPNEQKKCANFFAEQDGEKEKALFSELRKLKSKSSEELAIKLYGDKLKAPNIRQLRMQVTEKLIHFIRENLLVSHEGLSNMRRLLDFADFLIGRHAPQLALEYLLEAETEATTARAYEMLESIYHYKLNHSQELGIDAKEAFEQWQLNHKRYVSYMHLLSARGILIQLLDEHRRLGILPKQAELMHEFYERFSPDDEERRNPDFMLRVSQIFRRVMLCTKDYWRIESAARDIYEFLLKHECFTPQDDAARRSFLLILAQAHYRNRKFEQAESYLKEVQQLLPTPIPRNDPDYAKLQAQRAAIYTYTNRCERAGELLRMHLYGPEPLENESERANMQLNLAVNYFCLKEYSRALEQMMKLNKTDQEYMSLLGLEWIYKKRMIHMIVCRELQQFEEAEELLVNMLHDFNEFLGQELYTRARVFMEFLLRWFRDPDLITNVDFHREVRDARFGWGDREDIQAIFFFCWFRAPMLGQQFYPTFQARLKEEGCDWDFPFSLK